mgnify:CR=1 FL=1
MHAPESHVDGAGRGRFRRRALRIVIVLLVLAIAAVVLLPCLISTQAGKRFVLGQINQRLDGQLEAQTLSMSWFNGLRLSGLTYTDASNKVSIRELSLQPDYLALLRGRVILGPTVVDGPDARIQVAAPKPIEEDTPSPATARGPAAVPAALLGGPVDVSVRDGRLALHMITPDAAERSVGFEDVQSRVTLQPRGKTAAFQLAAAVVDGQDRSSIRAEGELRDEGETDAWTFAGTSGQVQVRIEKLSLESLEPLTALLGKAFKAAGVLDADADIVLDRGRPEKVSVQSRLVDFRGAMQGREIVLEQPVKVDAEIARQDQRYQVDRLQIESPFCTLHSTARDDGLAFELTANLARTQEFVTQFVPLGDMAVGGNVEASGLVRFDEAGTAVTGTGKFARLTVANDKTRTEATEAQAAFDLRFAADWTALSVQSLQWTSDPATVKLTASHVPLGGEVTTPMDWHVNGTADLAKAMPFISVVHPLPEGMGLAGQLRAEAEGTYDGKAWTVSVAPSTIQGLVLRQPDAQPFIQDTVAVAGKAVIDTTTKSIDVHDVDVLAQRGESKIHVTKGAYAQSETEQEHRVEGRFDAEYALRSDSPLLPGVVPDGLDMAGTSRATFKSTYAADEPDGFIKGLQAEAAMDLAGTRYKGVAVESGQADLKITDGRARIHVPEAKANGGTMRFDGTVDLAASPRMLEYAEPLHLVEGVQINEEMGRELLIYLGPLLAGQGTLSGTLDFQSRRLAVPLGSGHADKAVLEGTIAMEQVNLQSRGFLAEVLSKTDKRGDVTARLLPTDITLKDGVLRYDSMEWHVDRYPVGFFGAVGLDKQLDLNVRLPYRVDYERPPVSTVHVGDDLAGRLVLAVDGTVDNPQVRLDRMLENIGRDILEEGVRRGLERLFR